MPTKAYFIGLGGCGLKTVAELQQKLCPTGDFREFKFTYVDTDDATVNELNKTKVVIKPGDLINVGDTNPHQVYVNAIGGRSKREKRFVEWVIPQNNGEKSQITFSLPNGFLSDGARGQRMIGRTSIHHRYDDIYRELAGKIDTFFEHEAHNAENLVPQIWVVASSCGGTGSSMTMDVLYMLDKIVNEKCQAAPELKLVLFMPKPFMEANSGNPDYPLNAFSYMWELNAFRLDYQMGINDRFYNFSVDDTGATGRTVPFYKFVIPVDVETSFGSKIPMESLYQTVADLIFYCNKGAAANKMVSSISNDQNQLLGQVTENKLTPFKWTRSLVPYGYRAIRKANDEFVKYMSTRALYEVLKFGVLGEKISDDPVVREKAKVTFAKNYIMKAICDLPQIGVNAAEASLQAEVASVFDSVRISPTNLDKQRITYCLNAIDECAGELKKIRAKVLDTIIKSIDEGVQKAILDNGLIYAKELLNLVDDFYLETVVLPALKLEKEDVLVSKETKRSECDKLCAGYKGEKQSAAVVKCLNEYKDLVQRYNILDLAMSIIDEDLTSFPAGHLEVLRKGDSRRNGLQNIINKLDGEAAKAYEEYISLAREFIKTENDALTEYLPSLSAIATGANDTYWAKDSLFDVMYHESVIAYDIEREMATKERIPARKNQGDNNLSMFVECVCKGETSILKLAQHDDRFRFERNFADWVMAPLHKQIELMISKDGTVASKWLRLTLEESLDAENMLPAGMTREQFINSLANRDRIPVLYPMVAGATRPTQIRVMFAGASESLARELGYNPVDNAGNSFVEDVEMNDRFLIIKMPLGLDFYSYKYFQDIQKEYKDRRREIQEGKWGCHIHREFACLDITKAVAKVQQQSVLPYVKTLYTGVYCQKFLDLLKTKQKPLYDRLWGDFNFIINEGDSAGNDPFGLGADDPFGLGGQASDDPFGMGDQSSADPFISSANDKFILDVDYRSGSQSFVLKINKVSKVDNHLEAVGDVAELEIDQIRSFTEFLKCISAKDEMDNMKDLSEAIVAFKSVVNSDDDLKRAFDSLIPATSAAFKESLLFKIAITWSKAKNPADSNYFNIIQEILKGRI